MVGIGEIPRGAALAIDDMVDHCAQIKADQEVLILAQIDGLYGGDNLVDEQTISWIQAAVQHRGANASVLWIDEPIKRHAWRINVDVHIGAPPPPSSYFYWMHCTGDIRNATRRVGDTLLLDQGHMTALDTPAVRAVAAKYPSRPGLQPIPMLIG